MNVITLKANVRNMLKKVDAGYYSVEDESLNVDHKSQPKKWTALRRRWVSETYRLQYEFWADAVKAVGLEDHPQAERIVSLVRNNGTVNTYEAQFRLLVDMASIALDTTAIGYNTHTGKYC